MISRPPEIMLNIIAETELGSIESLSQLRIDQFPDLMAVNSFSSGGDNRTRQSVAARTQRKVSMLLMGGVSRGNPAELSRAMVES
jgi:hypothetical protein